MNTRKISIKEIREDIGVSYNLSYLVNDNLDIEISITENIVGNTNNQYKGMQYYRLYELYKDLEKSFKNDYKAIKEHHELFIKRGPKKEAEYQKDGFIKKMLKDIVGKNIKHDDSIKDDRLKYLWHKEKLRKLEELKNLIKEGKLPINELEDEYEKVEQKFYEGDKYYVIDIRNEIKPEVEFIVIDKVNLILNKNKIDYHYNFKSFDIEFIDLNNINFNENKNFYKIPDVELYLYKNKEAGYKHIVSHLEKISLNNIINFKELAVIANKADRVFK